MEKRKNDQKIAANKAKLQLALSDIMNGHLFLDEAVQKYEVPASTIIKHLKKILKEKKETIQLNDSTRMLKGFGDNYNNLKGNTEKIKQSKHNCKSYPWPLHT